jgi:RNA polymerase sigma-70 factor (ECF subfamily)
VVCRPNGRSHIVRLGYLGRLTGDVDLALDLAQDTFLQAFRSIKRTNAKLSLRAWLYKIATNNANQHHRRRRLLSFLPFGGDDAPRLANASADPARTDVRLDIERALMLVPKEQRAAMVLHYVEGLKYR